VFTKVPDMAADDAFGKKIMKSLFQAALLLLVGILLGSAINSLRHDGLAWVGHFSPPETGASVLPITITEAWRDYQKGLVQFVDARSPSEYAAGHLPGAVNVPAEGAEAQAGRIKLPAGRMLVIYCSDPACPRSAELASVLDRQGMKGLRVMPEGWAGWYDAGLPFEGKGGG
jgi:rhodanese-related sulfurtransferase